MPSVLVVSFSELHRDPRVLRQLRVLTDEKFHVFAAGYTDPKLECVSFKKICKTRRSIQKKIWDAIIIKSGLRRKFYEGINEVKSLKKMWPIMDNEGIDLFVANDIDTLMVTLDIAKGRPVFFDAHEFFPRENEAFLWRFVLSGYKDWQCRTFVKRADSFSTVGPGIRDGFRAHYGLDPIIIKNAPFYNCMDPTKCLDGKIRLVHHGSAAPGRGLEELVDMMRMLDRRFSLHFYLVGPDTYLNMLKKLARDVDVAFHKPVRTNDLPIELNQYDMGLHLAQPVNYNNQYCLPNKFFEFVQGRLAVGVGPTPDMASLVREHNLGVVSRDFSSRAMARELNGLEIKDIEKFKGNAHRAARELSFEPSAEIFMSEVGRLLSR